MFDLRELIWRNEDALEKPLNMITQIDSNEEFEVTMNIIRIARIQGRLGAWKLNNRKLLALRNAFERVCFLGVRKLLLLALNILLVCDNALGLCQNLRDKLGKSWRKIRALQLEVSILKGNLYAARLNALRIQLLKQLGDLLRNPRVSLKRCPILGALFFKDVRDFHKNAQIRPNEKS
jgi:hypothetical protein